jgi:phosphatidylserine/phosphatidylglycerophosphate/cardiolipin synthase-like enzyme
MNRKPVVYTFLVLAGVLIGLVGGNFFSFNLYPSAVSLADNTTACVSQQSKGKALFGPICEPESDTTVEIFFVPGDNPEARIVRAITSAKHQILVQSFLFTNKRIANALIKAHNAGRSVEVINDKTAYLTKQAPVLRSLVAAGIPVYLDGKHSTAHNKIMEIDSHDPRPVVITGSYNFTVAAQKYNAENLLVFTGDHTLANAYRTNWTKHKRHSSKLK